MNMTATAICVTISILGLVPTANPPEEQGDAFLEVRIWTDISGRYRTRAVLKKISDGNVHLEKEDSSSVIVPIERLSLEDQELIRALSERGLLATDTAINEAEKREDDSHPAATATGDGTSSHPPPLVLSDSGDQPVFETKQPGIGPEISPNQGAKPDRVVAETDAHERVPSATSRPEADSNWGGIVLLLLVVSGASLGAIFIIRAVRRERQRTRYVQRGFEAIVEECYCSDSCRATAERMVRERRDRSRKCSICASPLNMSSAHILYTFGLFEQGIRLAEPAFNLDFTYEDGTFRPYTAVCNHENCLARAGALLNQSRLCIVCGKPLRH